MAIYTSTRERSNTSSGVFATVYINSLTAQSQVRIQGQVILELTGTKTSHPATNIPVYILDSTGATLTSFNIYSPSGWSSGSTYPHNFDVSFNNTISGYNGSLIFQIKNSSETLSWVYPYRPVIKSVSWSGYSGSGLSGPDTPGFDWGNNDYTPSITYPSNPSSFTTSTGVTKFKSGTLVTLKWGQPSTFGSFSDNYYYELVANGKTLYKGKGATFTVTINSSTVYTIYCKSGTGITSGSGRQLSLIVPDNIGVANIIGVGKSNSNPGFSPIGINEDILISWEKPNTPNNNLVKNYSIYFNDVLIASKVSGTSYTLKNYNLTEQSYKVTVQAYDEVGNYTTSKPCYLYTVNPSFNYGPRGETSVLLDKSRINWGELKTGSLDNSLLNIKYTLKYLPTSTATVATIEETDNYLLIEEDLIDTFYSWNTLESGIKDGDLVSLKVIGTIYKDNIEIISTEITSDDEERLFKGKLPSKFNKIIFSIPKGQYYGDSSPMEIIYNINETAEGGNWQKGFENTIYNFTDYLQIDCYFNKDNWEKSSEYIDAVQLKWKKGLYSGEIINKNLNEENKSFSIILSKENNMELFSQSNEPINFEIYSLYETKKSDNSGSGIYIFSDSASLSFKEPTKFVRAKLPQIYNNGTSIPSLNSNMVRNVDFFKKEINSTAANNNIWEKDYQLSDLRANNVVSNVPVIGFKIYVTKDLENYKEKGSIVNISNYLKQTNGEVSFHSDKFFEFSLPLIKSEETSATSSTEGFVGFYPQILNDDNYLKQMFGNISSLQTLSTVETFYYVVAAIDALKQESIINYILPVTYDFRLAAEFQEGTTPVLINSGFTSVTVNEKTGYLFHGQTDTFDWITFEWYPAFNKNDYLLNPSNYEEVNGIYYLKPEAEDKNSYTLYKWVDGEYRSKRLIAGIDFKAVTDESLGVGVKKYIAKYAMNLKDNKVSEYFNLTLMPSYIDKYKEEKMATPIKTLNPIEEVIKHETGEVIEYEKKIAYFHLSRFTPMKVSIGSEISRIDQTEFIVNLNANDWGILTGEEINNISSKMILRNSSIKADSGDALQGILSNNQGSFELEVTPTYGADQIVYDFKGHASKIYDNMPFSSETIITITINRFSEKDYTISKSGTSSITTTYNYYIPANFSTLSLRKNKVGINYSNLTNTEEALYVVAKDRIDSGNDVGNVAVYGNTYPHVFSIQGNLDTKMPSFSKETGEALTTLQEASIYMGFYTVNNESKPYRVGSFGIEEGQPYFVYKGKYYSDTTRGKNNCEKCYDNKDYFEKISIRNLPVPPGTMVLYPKININSLINLNTTWYVCDGTQTVTLRNNANLIKAIFPKTDWEGKSEIYEFTIPRRDPVGKISTEPMYNEDGQIIGHQEINLSKEYCYIIKGDA